MRINVWIQVKNEIPDLSPLIGVEDWVLEERYRRAKAEGRLCIFQVEVTEEQWNAIREHHGDQLLQLAYLTQER